MEKEGNRTSFKEALKSINIRSYTMVFLLVGVTIFLTIMTKGLFASSRNISMLFRQMAVTGIISCGMFLQIVHGNIDLSVGTVMFLSSTFAGVLQVRLGWTSFPAIVFLSVLIGLLVGAWNGFWVAYRGLPPFIATLGSQMICRGAALALANGALLGPFIESIQYIGQAYIPKMAGWIFALVGVAATILIVLKGVNSKKRFGLPVPQMSITIAKILLYCGLIVGGVAILNSYQGVAFPVVIVIVLGIIFAFLTKKTSFGRSLYAIGSNKTAARFSGINVEKNSFTAYLISGTLAAFAGVVMAARLNMATTTIGNMAEMDAIMACVIGGASMSGGSGNVIGVLAGALLVAAIDNGMSLMNMDSFWQYVVKGLVLTIIVFYDIQSSKKR